MKKYCVALAALLLAASLQAQEMPMRGPIPFSAYDQNGDGSISEAEFHAVRSERMQQRAEEGRPMRNAANAPLFSDFDTDGNKQLSQEELSAGQAAQRAKRMEQRQGGGMGMGMGQNR